jgi:arylsulfatase A-like enzyme
LVPAFHDEVIVNQPNILFLMVDCARADILWDRQRYPKVPNLDRLSERSAVFTHAIAAATTTTPSVATMLTGLPLAEHGIRSLLGYKLNPDVHTLAEALRDGGYYTAGEVTGPLFPETGLNRGFLHYRRRDRHWYLNTDWGDELRRALRTRAMPQPWFLFLHIWELHWPRKAGRFNRGEYGRTLYQRSVAYVDDLIGQLLEAIDLDNTVVVITGDHGEGVAGAIDDPRPIVQAGIQWSYRLTRRLPATTKKRILTLAKNLILVPKKKPTNGAAKLSGPRAEIAGHAAMIAYDYLVRVPLIVHAPGQVPARRIEHQVRHLDIAPTILDLAGLGGYRPGLQPSLVPMARGEEDADRPSVTEALQTMLHDPLRRLIGYRTGRYKLIYAPDNPEVAPELYDLRADPGELRNLAPLQPELVAELRRRVERGDDDALAAVGSTAASGQAQRMTAEEEEIIRDRLEQLGYIE